jgi:hypothetical protein
VFLATVYGGSFVASAVKIYLSLKTLQGTLCILFLCARGIRLMSWIVTIEAIPGLPSMCAAKSYDQELYLYWVFMIIVDTGERNHVEPLCD